MTSEIKYFNGVLGMLQIFKLKLYLTMI